MSAVSGAQKTTFTAFHIGHQALFVTGRHEIPSVSLVAINRKNARSPWTISPIPFHTAYVISSFHRHQPQIYNIKVYKIDRGTSVRVMSMG